MKSIDSVVDPETDVSPGVFRAVVAVILVAAALLRLAGIGARPLWHDECISVIMTLLPGSAWQAAASPTSPDANPPLYYGLLKPWISLFGLSEAGVRSLSLCLGILQIGAMGLLAGALGFTRRAQLWTMGLCAVASLQVFYSTEARAYMLLLVLLTLAMAAFLMGVRTGWWRYWIAHAVALALAFYTHNLALPFACVFWIAALALRAPRKIWLCLLLSHALAAVVYLPWLPVALRQNERGAYKWIKYFWHGSRPISTVARSLEAFGVGGKVPAYIKESEAGMVARGLSIGMFALGALAAMVPLNWMRRCTSAPPCPENAPGGSPKVPEFLSDGQRVALLMIFLVWPLVFLLTYSYVRAPLYLVSRYDIVAQPAYLALIGLGIARWECVMAPRIGRAFAAVLITALVVLTVASQRTSLISPALVDRSSDSLQRGMILKEYLSADDAIVCTGLTTGETRYLMARYDLKAKMVTFPASLSDHLGWYNPDDVLLSEGRALDAQADVVASLITLPQRRHRILWLMADMRDTGTAEHRTILAGLVKQLKMRGCETCFPPDKKALWTSLGVYPLYCGDAPPLVPKSSPAQSP